MARRRPGGTRRGGRISGDRDDISTAPSQCASGRELIEIGFADDVRTAAQLDSGGAIPLLRDGAFIPA